VITPQYTLKQVLQHFMDGKLMNYTCNKLSLILSNQLQICSQELKKNNKNTRQEQGKQTAERL